MAAAQDDTSQPHFPSAPLETAGTVLYLDYDNLLGGASSGTTEADTAQWLPRLQMRILEETGEVPHTRAYANWEHCPDECQTLESLGVSRRHVPTLPRHGKNGADMAMAVDITDHLHKYPHIHTFVIASGDSDMLAVLARIQQDKKKTILAAWPVTMSKEMDKCCDRVVRLCDVLEPDFPPTQAQLYLAYDQLEKVLLERFAPGTFVSLEEARSVMIADDPAFYEPRLAYSSFQDFVADATAHASHVDGHVSLVDGNLAVTSLSLRGAPLAPAAAGGQSAAAENGGDSDSDSDAADAPGKWISVTRFKTWKQSTLVFATLLDDISDYLTEAGWGVATSLSSVAHMRSTLPTFVAAIMAVLLQAGVGGVRLHHLRRRAHSIGIKYVGARPSWGEALASEQSGISDADADRMRLDLARTSTDGMDAVVAMVVHLCCKKCPGQAQLPWGRARVRVPNWVRSTDRMVNTALTKLYFGLQLQRGSPLLRCCWEMLQAARDCGACRADSRH